MQDNSATVLQENNVQEKANTKALLSATDKDLHLANFLQYAIDNGIKGRTKLPEAAKEKGINLTYERLNSLVNSFRSKGLEGILRTNRSDKDELRATSPEVLQLVITKFIDFQCAIRTYEEVHKMLRTRSIEFKTKEGQVYNISTEIVDGKKNSVLYQSNETTAVFSTVFVAGTYITHDAEELSIGSYQSIASHLKDVRQDQGDALHIKKYGLSSYRLKREHSIYRDYSNLQPNDLWSADNKKLDIIVIDYGWNKVFRPWLSGFLRVPTRQYSYEISASPNSESIANSFVLAARKWGLPKEINHDLGKDYLADRLEKMFQSLNIKQTKSISRNARAKAIESFHNILDNKLKCLVGYTGNKYQEMPERTKIMLRNFTKAEKIFKNIDKQVFDEDFKITLNGDLQGRLKKSKQRFLHITELLTVLEDAMREYEETLHGGLSKDKLGKKVYNLLCDDELINGMSERLNTPAGRYDYWMKAGFNPVYARSEVLAIFAMNSAIRTVRVSGIQLNENVYFSPKLKRHIGKKVLVKYTNASDNFIYIFSSPEIDNLKNEAEFRESNGFDIVNRSEFVALCEKIKIHDYGDKSFIPELANQRKEEKHLKEVAGITKITGFEGNIIEIQNQTEEIFHKNNKYKNLKDAFDE